MGRSRRSSITMALSLLAYAMGSTMAQNLTCSRAIELHKYALELTNTCNVSPTQRDSSPSLCYLLKQSEKQSTYGDSKAAHDDQINFISDPSTASRLKPWQNYLIQSALTQVADLGEVSYVLNTINATYSNLTNWVTNEDYLAAWQDPWWQQADQNRQTADDSLADPLSLSQLYFKAANYYFTGSWPSPFSSESLTRAEDSVSAFQAGLDSHPFWLGYNFSVPFNNGTATASLPGYFITPNSNAPLPLMIVTGGADLPKEMTALQFGLSALERGYALVVYDGPGQGQVIRNPPYMPVYPRWEDVFTTVLDYVEQNYAGFVDIDDVVHQGVGLGGYLAGEACSLTSDRLRSCVPNPPILSLSPIYERLSNNIAEALYGGFSHAARSNHSTLPEGYAQDFLDSNKIMNTLLLTCNASSGAPELIAEALTSSNGPMDPQLQYLAGGYASVVSGDPKILASGVWDAFRAVQAFGPYNVSNISVPVVAIKSTEDDRLGGQEDEWFSKLTGLTAISSSLVTLDAASGAALQNQAGSSIIYNAQMYGPLAHIVNSATNYTTY